MRDDARDVPVVPFEFFGHEIVGYNVASEEDEGIARSRDVVLVLLARV
jgi:hypothetical protein